MSRSLRERVPVVQPSPVVLPRTNTIIRPPKVAPPKPKFSKSLESHIRRNLKAKLSVRPYYDSEDDDDDDVVHEPPPPDPSMAPIGNSADDPIELKDESPEAEERKSVDSEGIDSDGDGDEIDITTQNQRNFPLLRRAQQPKQNLTEHLFSRISGPSVKQWQMNLAQAKGTLADPGDSSRRWEYVQEFVPTAAPHAAAASSSTQKLSKKAAAAAAAAAEAQAAVAAAVASNRPVVPCSYSRPFDVRRPPDAQAPNAEGKPGSKTAPNAPAEKYWIYLSSKVKKLPKDPGYSITNHSFYYDEVPLRASPSLTPAELGALTPVAPGEACRHNGLTFIRQMRVKVKDSTKVELDRVFKTVTGEIDKKVLSICENGIINKAKVYRTDDYNYTLISTEKILSGEPICSWNGTLRERSTFAQRVGFETSLIHIWAYDIFAKDLPDGYAGPDLVMDASEYGNESHFLRDPKWSHQQADANVAVRLVWNQDKGLPYLCFVALCDIAPHAELFVDWGADCWKTVWRTQLTALATNSHLQHQYLTRLQQVCNDVGISPLPRLPGSKFALKPLPEDEEKALQQHFLDEELSPFRTTSATLLEKKERVKSKPDCDPTPTPMEIDDPSPAAIPAAASSSAVASQQPALPSSSKGRGKRPGTSSVAAASSAQPKPAPSKARSISPISIASAGSLSPTVSPRAAAASYASSSKKKRGSTKNTVAHAPALAVASQRGTPAAAAASSSSASTAIDANDDTRTRRSGLRPALNIDVNAAKAASSSSAKKKGARVGKKNQAAGATASAASEDLEMKDASTNAADAVEDEDEPSPVPSTPSSPYTPAFNTHKAFAATQSHTMLTVFAAAMLNENLAELARVKRRVEKHRLNRFVRMKKRRSPILQGAIHQHGQHTFQLLDDPAHAFFKSGTRLGRDCKIAVCDETKQYVAEAFGILRPRDLPLPRDAKLIREGNVPKSRIYEVVGMDHPARFFTRPDQTPFSLVASEKYNKGEAIGVYIGVFRDFHVFHKASDFDALKQVFAYDCVARNVPGPPNPYLSAEDRKLPLKDQLAYRGGDLVVESLYWGNEIRFMNDAYGRMGGDMCVNAQAEIAWDPDRQWPCILIRAKCAIPKGDEVIVDYGDSFWNKVARSLMMDHAAYGDECRQFIEQTEQWLQMHGVPLPERPQSRKDLPVLFTQDIRRTEVTYPKYFLQPFDKEVDLSVSELDAAKELEQGRAKVDRWLRKYKEMPAKSVMKPTATPAIAPSKNPLARVSHPILAPLMDRDDDFEERKEGASSASASYSSLAHTRQRTGIDYSDMKDGVWVGTHATPSVATTTARTRGMKRPPSPADPSIVPSPPMLHETTSSSSKIIPRYAKRRKMIVKGEPTDTLATTHEVNTKY